MKKSKTLKTLAMGFVIGAACMMTTTAIGASKTVSAIINDNLFFRINGEFSKATEEDAILNYNGYNYVPLRFIAEKLGCDVQWDPVTKTVTVRGAEPTEKIVEVEKVVEVEKIVYVNDENAEGSKVYKKLPTSYKTNEFEIELLGLARRSTDDQTRVFVNIINNRQEVLQLDQKQTVLTVDGKEYKMSDMVAYWDQNWYNDVRSNDEKEGYLVFDLIDEDWSTASLELTLKLMGSNGKYTYEEVCINFKK